jgi:hypothetical protein
MESEGWALRARHALGRLRRSTGVDTFDVFVREVSEEHRSFCAPDGYRFAWGTPEQLAACEQHHTELDAHELQAGRQRLLLGHRLVLGLHRAPDGRELAVFSMWVNPRHLNVPGHLKRRLRDDQVFIYKAYTSPDHRGRRLYEAGMRFVLHDLAGRGMKELVGYAHVGKTVSRKGLAALGFTSRGRFRRFHSPVLCFCVASSGVNRWFPGRARRSDALAALDAGRHA